MMVPGIHIMYDMKPAPAAPTDALMNTQIWLAEQNQFLLSTDKGPSFFLLLLFIVIQLTQCYILT